MSLLIDKMLARVGKSIDDIAPTSKLGKTLRRNGVMDTSELRRIARLPRREMDLEGQDPAFVEALSDYLKTPSGTMKLRPLQAAALREMHDYGGLFGSIKVGGGKTLLSLLAPTVLEAKRPLLLVPAKLRDKTRREMKVLQDHWQIADNIYIESYELLGREQGSKVIEQVRPDLIIADEVHKLKNPKAAVTRRVRRYMHENTDTKFVALSGTITKRSLLDYHHIVYWCLPKHAPMPKSYPEVRDWGNALDEDVDFMNRLQPGALGIFMDDEDRLVSEKDPLTAARTAFRKRFIQTPGIIATSEKFTGSSLTLQLLHPKLGQGARDAYEHLKTNWETPDEHPVAERTALWRHAREIACGFYYVWNPRPPQEWLEARRAWCKFAREVLKHSRTLDTELQVMRAHGDVVEAKEWRRIKDTFEPNTEPRWVDDAMLNYVADWMKQGPGIVWVEHRAFGEKLSQQTGVSYFANGGLDKGGVPIEMADPSSVVIASVASNSEGRNLQDWNRNLVVSCAPTGILWEQLLGRTHREGQQAEEVTCDIILACVEQWSGLLQARADAKYLRDSLGQDQKLLHADWLGLPTSGEIPPGILM